MKAIITKFQALSSLFLCFHILGSVIYAEDSYSNSESDFNRLLEKFRVTKTDS